MVSLLILTLILLTKLSESSKRVYSTERNENITDYEKVSFNLDSFSSFGIIEFDYNNIHYKVKLIKNDHISPIINHQTDKNISITHHNKHDNSWYDFIVYTHTSIRQNTMLHISTIVLFFMYDKPLDLVQRFIYSE